MDYVTARCTIEGISQLSQSRYHETPKLSGELPDAWNKRVWREQLHVSNGTVHIPAHGMHQSMIAAGKYSKKQIPGQGKATWTAKFTSGIAFFDDLDLGIKPEEVDYIDIHANADGIRGSGKRVMRRFPVIKPGWRSSFDVVVLDRIITQEIFTEILTITGIFIGIGRFRPEKGGTNGRFRVKSVEFEAGLPEGIAA